MKKKGFTLTEIILTMSVAAIIIIMGLLVYKKVHDKAEENLIITILNNINSNTDALFGYGYVKNSNHTFTQAQQDYIFKGDFPDSDVKVSGGPAYSGDQMFTKGEFMFGYSFSYSQIGNGNNYYNFLTLEMLVPQDICASLIEKIVSKGDFIVVGNTTSSTTNTFFVSPSNPILDSQYIKDASSTTSAISMDTSLDPGKYAEFCSLAKYDNERSVIDIEKIF